VLDRIVAMLTKLGRRGYSVRDASAQYAARGIDTDADPDSDPEWNQSAGKLPNTRCNRPAPRRR
jgi:hypothetical protein